ncbi:hypothetical protein P5V15_013199 [Pogonomyrmex californicus]
MQSAVESVQTATKASVSSGVDLTKAESDSLAVFSELLRYTSVRELSLCNARLHLAVHEGPLSRLGRRDDAGAELLRAAPPPACPAIVFLRLAGFQVREHSPLEYTSPLWNTPL